MIDINFYMRTHELKKRLMAGEKVDPGRILEYFEEARSRYPTVYNIETTNACNMKCAMCPRTTKMTRKIESLDVDTFTRVVRQLQPHNKELWLEWEKFVHTEYGIDRNDMSENHFFLHIIPKVIQLHGYGDPLLDKNMIDFVRTLTEGGFESYFSCNPSNIDVDKITTMFENGLSYVKFSVESTDDSIHKSIRGEMSDFTKSCEKIDRLLEVKKKGKYKTTIVVTMIDLNREKQADDYRRLEEFFHGKDVYLYLKSEDSQWYRGEKHATKSIHWTEFCQHPWTSMTVKSNGDVAICMEDYNNDPILGNTHQETLEEIWNGKKYSELRESHVWLSPLRRCDHECDMQRVGELIK